MTDTAEAPATAGAAPTASPTADPLKTAALAAVATSSAPSSAASSGAATSGAASSADADHRTAADGDDATWADGRDDQSGGDGGGAEDGAETGGGETGGGEDDASALSDAFVGFAAELERQLSREALEAPVEIAPLRDATITLRIDVAMWPKDGLSGAIPISAERIALAAALEADPWLALGGADDALGGDITLEALGLSQAALFDGDGYAYSLRLSAAGGSAAEIDGRETDDAETLLAAARRAYRHVAAARAFHPRMVDFQTSGAAHLAIFEAELPLLAAQARIGDATSATRARIEAAGAPALPIDAPPLIDLIHQRAFEAAPLSRTAGRRRTAQVLMRSEIGRRALAASTGLDGALDEVAKTPAASLGETGEIGAASELHDAMVSPQHMRRLARLARRTRDEVGGAGLGWFWPATAVAGPALALGLLSVGYTETLQEAFAPAAAVLTSAPLDTGAIETASTRNNAETLVAAHLPAALIALAPFVFLWLLAVSGYAALRARAERRALGVARRARFGPVVARSAAPAAAFAAGAALYAVTLFGPPPMPDAEVATARLAAFWSPAGDDRPLDVDIDVALSDTASIETSGVRVRQTPTAPRGSLTPPSPDAASALPEDAFSGLLLRATPISWRLIDGGAMVAALGRPAVLELSCDGGRTVVSLIAPDLGAGARDIQGRPLGGGVSRAQLMIDGVAAGPAVRARPGGARAGVPARSATWWPASLAAIDALGRGETARVFLTSANRAVTRSFDFSLDGFADAAEAVRRDCRA